MAWIAENRRNPLEKRAEPYLTEALKVYLTNKYLPRFPNKRAATLPALHAVQHEYGWIPMQAMEEIADFLGLAPSEVLDTATFYEEYWLKPKGKYLIAVCRSLACELCGSKQLLQKLQDKLKIEPMETTDDQRFTIMEIECLGSCGTAPVALINEMLIENLSPAMLESIMDNLPANPHDYKDPVVDWPIDGPRMHDRLGELSAPSPSLGTPGEGRGGGL